MQKRGAAERSTTNSKPTNMLQSSTLLLKNKYSYTQEDLYIMFDNDLINPLTDIIDAEYEEVPNDSGTNMFGMDFSFFQSDKAKITSADDGVTSTENKPKRKYTKKDKDGTLNVAEVIDNIGAPTSQYDAAFEDTNIELRKAIAQTDVLIGEIKEDTDRIRSSSTIKNKYTYITNLTASQSALIGTKIQAIRELNNSKSTALKMELDRQKLMKDDASKQDDNMRIMDLYNAFVNAPVGSYNPNPMPTLMDLTASATGGASGDINFVGVDINTDDPSMLSPQQIAMRASEDRNVRTIVRYNAETGARMFDVINTQTGQSIPNVERPDNFLLQDTTLDIQNKIARNRNIGQTWDLVIEGNTALDEY